MQAKPVAWKKVALFLLVGLLSAGGFYLYKRNPKPVAGLTLQQTKLPGLVADLPQGEVIAADKSFHNGRYTIARPGGLVGSVEVRWQAFDEDYTREEVEMIGETLVGGFPDIVSKDVTETQLAPHPGYKLRALGKRMKIVMSLWHCPEHQRNIIVSTAFAANIAEIETLHKKIMTSVRCHQGKAPPADAPEELRVQFSHPDFQSEEGSVPPSYLSDQGEIVFISPQADDIARNIDKNPAVLQSLVNSLLKSHGLPDPKHLADIAYRAADGNQVISHLYETTENNQPIYLVIAFHSCPGGKGYGAFYSKEGGERPTNARLQEVLGAVKCTGRVH